MANPLGDYKARQAARAAMKQENQRRLGAVQAEFSRRQAERADTIARSAGDYATPEGEIDESLGRAGTYGGKFLRGLGSTVASVPRAVADVTQLATGYDPEFLRSAGQGIEDFANQADVNPEYADEFGGKVAGALGTATGFLAGGVVGGGVKAAGYGAASLAAKAALPVSSGISEMTEDFRRTMGRDPTQGELAQLVPIGTGLGAMEYLPVGRALGRFGKATAGTGNKIRKNKGYIAQEGAKGFAEEAIQESAQTVAQDFAAKQMYDEDREVLAGLEEAATVGGTTGFLMNAALVAAGVKLRSGKPNDDQKENMKNAVAEDEDFRKNAVKDSEKLVGLQKEAADLNVQIATAKAAEGSSPEAVAALEEKRDIVIADMKGLMQAGVASPQDLEGTAPRDEDTLADVGYDVEEAGIPGVGTQEENDLYDLLDREAEQAQLDQDAANIEVEEFEGAPYVGGLDVDEMTVEEIDIPVVRSMKEMLRTTEEELEARKNPQTPVAATIEPEQKEELRAAQTEVKKKTKKAKKSRGLPSVGAAKAGKENKSTTTKRSPLPTAPAERGARTAETLDKVEKVRKKVAKRKPVQADLTPVANEIRQEISDWADQKGKMDAKEFRGGMNQLRMRLTNEMRSQYTPEELTAQKLREIGKEITSYIKEITPSAAMIKANKEGAESAKPTTAESLKAELLGLTGAEESEDGSVSIPTDMTGTVEGPEQFKEVVENQRLSGVRKSKQDLGQTNTQENWNAYISSVVALVNSKLKVTGEYRPAEARLETRNVLEQLSNEGLLDPKLVGQEANIAVEAAKFGEFKQKEVAELVTQLETQYPLKENGKGRDVKEPLVITRGEVEAYNTALKELGLYGRTLKTKNKGASYELRLVNKNKHIKEGQEPLQVLYNAPSFTTFTPEDMEKMATEPDVGAPPEKATPLYNEEEAAKVAPVTNPLTGEPTAAEQIPTAEEVDDTVEELARITPTQINRMRKADVTKALVDLGGFYEEELPATVPERKKLLKEAIGEAQDYVNQVPADTTPTAPADTGGGILGRPMRATPGVPEFGKESQRPAIERGEEETATVDPAKNPFDYEGATPRLESGDALEEASETAQSSTEEKFFSGEKMSKKDMDNLVNSMHDDLYSNEIDDTLEAPPLDYSGEAWSESGAAVLKVLDRESQTGTPTQFSHILEVLRDTLPKGSSEEALVKILLSKNLRTTIEVVNTLDSAEGRSIGGDYNVNRQHIRLNRQQMPSDISQVLVHEGVHAVTSHMYRTDPDFKEQIDLLYQAGKKAYEKYKLENGVDGIDGVDYGMSAPEEFLAEMFANPLMQRFANSVQYNSGKWGKLANIFRAFVDTIRRGLGLDVKENTVLYQTLVTGYRGMRTQNQIDQMTAEFDVDNVPIEMLDPFYEAPLGTLNEWTKSWIRKGTDAPLFRRWAGKNTRIVEPDEAAKFLARYEENPAFYELTGGLDENNSDEVMKLQDQLLSSMEDMKGQMSAYEDIIPEAFVPTSNSLIMKDQDPYPYLDERTDYFHEAHRILSKYREMESTVDILQTGDLLYINGDLTNLNMPFKTGEAVAVRGYHGSTDPSIGQTTAGFDFSRAGSNTNSQSAKDAVWFAHSPRVANSYSRLYGSDPIAAPTNPIYQNMVDNKTPWKERLKDKVFDKRMPKPEGWAGKPDLGLSVRDYIIGAGGLYEYDNLTVLQTIDGKEDVLTGYQRYDFIEKRTMDVFFNLENAQAGEGVSYTIELKDNDKYQAPKKTITKTFKTAKEVRDFIVKRGANRFNMSDEFDQATSIRGAATEAMGDEMYHGLMWGTVDDPTELLSTSYPAYIKFKNPLVTYYGNTGYTHAKPIRELTAQALQEGRDGIIIIGISDGGPNAIHYATIEPKDNVRSIFNEGKFKTFLKSTPTDLAQHRLTLKKTDELRNIVDAGLTPSGGTESVAITSEDLTSYIQSMNMAIQRQIANGDVTDYRLDLVRIEKQGMYMSSLVEAGMDENSVTVQREMHNLITLMDNVIARANGQVEAVFTYRQDYISEYESTRGTPVETQAYQNLLTALKRKEQSGNYLTPSEVNFILYSEMASKLETSDRMLSLDGTLNAPPISEAPVPDTGEQYLVGGTAEKQYTADGKRIPRPFTSKAYSHEDMVQTMKGAAKITQQSIDSAHGIAAKAASQWHTYLRNMKPFTGYRLLKDMVDQRAYLTGRNVSMGNASTFDEMANFFARTFNNLKQKEMELLTDYMTKREGNINLVPERIREAALSAKENIIAMGDELVRLGVLDENIHNTTKGSYLGRMYLMFMSLPNEKGQVSTTGGTGAKTSLMEYMKKRSLQDEDLKELYGFINDPAMRTASTISKVGRDIGIFRFMENINTFAQMQGQDPWVFPDMEEKFQLKNLDREGNEIDFRDPMSIPDALDALRQMEKGVVTHGFQKGETEGGESMAAGLVRLNRDKINEVLTTMQTKRAESLTDPAEREQFEQGNFAELDITKYTKLAENGRNGKLSGKWIRNEIYNDLRSNTFAFSTENASTAEKLLGQNSALTKGNKIWKATKTIYNLPAHPRNFISNFINFDTSTDTPTLEVMRLVYETAKEWYFARTKDGLKYPNDPIWRLADSSGMTEATWTAQESIQFGNDWQYANRQGKESEWVKMLPDGGFKDHMIKHMPHMSGAGVSFLSKIAQVYQGNETIFRVAKLKDELAKLKKANPDATPMELKALEQVAVQQSNEAIFDYTNITQSGKYFRNAPVGAPFISFTYLALPRIIENMAKHPIKMLKYITLPYLMGEFAASMGAFDEDDWETAKNKAPGFLKDKHTLMPMPWKDEDGKNIVWDLSYYLPYAPFLETAHQYKNILSGTDTETGVLDPVIRNFGILSGPVPDIITAAKSGMDPFTQQPIVDPNGGTGDKALDVLMYGWGVAAPTFLTHHGLLGNMYKQATNKGNINPRTGGERTSLTEGILRGFGTSVYSYDADDSRGVNARYYASLLNQQKAADKRKLKQMVAEGASFEKIAKERRSSAERQTIYRNNYQSYLEETQ